MRYFFCKLHGPRASFPADITPEELALMKAHSAYWSEQMGAAMSWCSARCRTPRRCTASW
jgi:hypothetical protein